MPRSLRFLLHAGATAVVLGSSLLAQTPVDLRTWTGESYYGAGSSNWTVNTTGDTVTQSTNGSVTFFYAPEQSSSGTFEGELTVTGGTDDDYVGFVIGIRPGATTTPASEYLLIDWKQITQSWNHAGCTPSTSARRGLAVSRVNGLPTDDELWGHLNLDVAPCSTASDSVTELARAATLGDTGWGRRVPYRFRFEFTPTRLRVLVNSVVEFDLNVRVPAGHFGFYNFSQAGVNYRAFTSSCTASASSYGAGHAGTLGIPSLTTSAAPLLGSTIDLLVGNALGSATAGALLFGPEAVSIPSGLGGDLLVLPAISISLAIPSAGASVPLAVPNDPFFCGGLLYLQAVHLDGGASQGIAFTPGLELVGGI
ncbi:MAG: hypothetical protein IPN34_14335 [Planctomycetes bacterium]|nr:hypothetical protein [Planctomycetota bacterium]